MEKEVDHDLMIRLQRLTEFLTNSSNPKDNQHDPLLLRNVFKFIHKNFNKLPQQIEMYDVLRILHFSLRMELQSNISMHVGSYVYALLNLNENNNDEALERCLQILYQILSTLSMEDTEYMKIGNEIFHKLVMILLANESAHNNANILACLQLYVKKFNAIEIVIYLWDSIKHTVNSNEITENNAVLQTLIYFFDDLSQTINEFNQLIEFVKLVRRLLNSNNHDNRKSAYFLLKKTNPLMEEQLLNQLEFSQVEAEQNAKRKNIFWNICIINFENLEENQSHLILPSLEKLRNLNISDLTEQIWLNILYCQILRHNNILVRRWILDYLLETFTYSSMTTETQIQFMHALNVTALYNAEGNMLSSENIGKFLACEKSNFVLAFSQIEWKSIPMHFWLSQLILHWKKLDAKHVSQPVLINCATKIRTMQNVSMRKENMRLFKELFSNIFDEMNLSNYVHLIETLHNSSDIYDDCEIFIKKLELCQEQNFDGDRIFTSRFYHILTNNDPFKDNHLNSVAHLIKDKIVLQNWRAGSLRFFLIFDSDDSCNEFCLEKYGINTSYIEPDMSLNDIFESFLQKLCESDEEKIIIQKMVTDYFVKLYIKCYDDLKTRNVTFEELLNFASFGTLKRLTDILLECKTFVGHDVVRCFAERFRQHMDPIYYYKRISNLIQHCNKTLNNVIDYNECLKILLQANIRIWTLLPEINTSFVTDSFLIEGALKGDPKTGDSKIEESYECLILKINAISWLSRYFCIRGIFQIPDAARKSSILRILFEKLNSINTQRPRYYANSKEHRLIVRILSIVIILISDTRISESFSELWKFLMEHNNQQNVAILYQIVIPFVTDWNELFEKVKEKITAGSNTPSQELSMIVLLYRSFKFHNHINEANLRHFIELLWPLTMGAHFQTRLYAQLILRDLSFSHKSNLLEKHCIDFIETNLSDAQMKHFQEDIRFIELNLQDAFDRVMQFTNAAFDEYNFIEYPAVEKSQKEPKSDIACYNFDLQRKISAVADFMPVPNLTAYPECEENALYIVASLIDKIPNLGGIARTCEVLGIKNLVIETKAHTSKADFKNLSMTADKTLNIIEVKPAALTNFILQKKTEGFEIVGAEQTANSCNFTTFKFPKRSVLLLGHEKEGIPPNILGLLDYAVEIPQFGMIRSLNVHVTGALFMWEYCKQHIIKT